MHPAGTIDDSDKYDDIQRLVVYESFFFSILKSLEEIGKCVSKLILQKNILY